MKVGVIGAGAISGIYLENMVKRFENLEVLAVAARHIENAEKQAKAYGIRACTTEEMLDDPEIEMVVILTPVGTHYSLIKEALLAGKHVYTEKTITDDLAKAKELCELASEKHLYLGCAPDTFLGSALQTARKAIDDGLIGEVTSCMASANRDNNILLSLFSFLREPGAGVCLDYGVYYITALVSLLGAVDEVAAFVRAPFPQHKNVIESSPLYGQMMDTPNESEVSAILKFRSGITGTFHLNADSVLKDQAHMIIYGTKGMLYLTDPNQFGGMVRYVPAIRSIREELVSIDLEPVNGYSGNERGLGPAQMACAIENGGELLPNADLGCHVLEVLEGMMKSSETSSFVRMESTCSRPQPLTQVL